MTTSSSGVGTSLNQNSSASTSQSTRISSSDTTSTSAQSTTYSPEVDLILNHINAIQKPQTPAQIKATGDVKKVEAEAKKIVLEVRNKTIVLIIIGIIAISLTLFGCAMFVFKPESAQSIWVIIGPIIIACTSGTIGFLTGEKQGANNNNQ